MVPAQTEALEVIVKDNPKIPIVTMESSLEGSCISVKPDNVWVGEQLAAAVKEDFRRDECCLWMLLRAAAEFVTDWKLPKNP